MTITRIGQYGQVKGSSYKYPCKVATTDNVDLSAGNCPTTVDGKAVSVGNRILVWKQSTASENGVYIVVSAGNWERDIDMSVSDDVYRGLQMYVNEGDTYGEKAFVLYSANPLTLGSSALDFKVSTSSGGSGSSGSSGISGTNGTSGINGSNGSSGSSGTSGLSPNLSLYVPMTVLTDTKNPTGFLFGDSVDISYSHTNRKITLSGSLDYYWKGTKHTLTSPWTSSVHDATIGKWYLSTTDGTNFTWSNSLWSFDQAQVASVDYKATAAASMGIRELHGTMDVDTHENLHANIGTYLVSGGQATVGSYTLATATDSANSPSFNSAVIQDEDLESTIPAWTKGTYTTMYVSGSQSVYNIASTLPFTANANAFVQVNNPTTGTMTVGQANRWYNVYQLLVPTTSDADSSKYRMVMLQPQATFTSLALAQAEDTRTLAFGELTNAEFTLHARITYATANSSNAGKCTIASINYVLGNKMSLINVSGISYSNHASLSNLDWGASGHTGTVNKIAGFDSNGATTYYDVAFPYTGSAIISGSLVITGSAETKPIAVTVASNTASIDMSAGSMFTVTLGNSATTHFNVVNLKAGATANILVTTGAVSSASFSSNIKQPSGSAYLPSSGSGVLDVLSIASWSSTAGYLVNVKRFI